MAKLPYEILLRWNNGKFAGAHISHIEDGIVVGPVAIGTADHPWPDIVTGINEAALAGHADATVRCRLAEDAALEVPSLRKQVTELTQALAEHQSVAKEQIEKLKADVTALTEELRIAKLPPSEQRAKELDAAMKAKEAELAALKEEHAALLDPA